MPRTHLRAPPPDPRLSVIHHALRAKIGPGALDSRHERRAPLRALSAVLTARPPPRGPGAVVRFDMLLSTWHSRPSPRESPRAPVLYARA